MSYEMIALLVQIVGLGLIIFKGGSYIGQSNEMFKGLTEKITRQDAVLTAHIEDDTNQFEKVHDTLTEIKIAVASNHPQKGK